MRDISEPDPHADAEVCEAHEEHHDVCDEEEVLGALLPPVQAVQVIGPHRAVAHPLSLAFTISQSLDLCVLNHFPPSLDGLISVERMRPLPPSES